MCFQDQALILTDKNLTAKIKNTQSAAIWEGWYCNVVHGNVLQPYRTPYRQTTEFHLMSQDLEFRIPWHHKTTRSSSIPLPTLDATATTSTL